MSATNRAVLITHALKVAKKHFKPRDVAKDRTLLEHMVYACCLENSLYEPADRVFHSLVSDYFDWNEVRVSTIRELSEVMKPLQDPEESATRVKRILQSVFETHYSYDLESLKKQNIGQAVKQLGNYNGNTSFISAFVTQHALGGHAIPISNGLLECLRIVGIVSDAEAAKGTAPGLDRAIPKNKGNEAAALLHQLGVEMTRSPFGANVRKLLLEISPDCKERLPKRSAAKSEEGPGADAAPTTAKAPPPDKTSPKLSEKTPAKESAGETRTASIGAEKGSKKEPVKGAEKGPAKGAKKGETQTGKPSAAKREKPTSVKLKKGGSGEKPGGDRTSVSSGTDGRAADKHAGKGDAKKPLKKVVPKTAKKIVKKETKKPAASATKKASDKKKIPTGAKPIARRKPR